MLFCGDTLFAAGCGRLFEGTPQQMHESLNRLARLPMHPRLLRHEYTLSNIRFAKAADPQPGAARTRIAAQQLRDRDLPTLLRHRQEKATNPFLRCDDPA